MVQITMARDESVLIKELLPLWSRFADGFIFCLDSTTDDSKEYLESVKEKYNILEIIENKRTDNNLAVETDIRQKLFDIALKYSNKIISLDADEYLDGSITKEQLENFLDNEKEILCHLQWIQYIGKNHIRTDGPWKTNFKEFIGCYQGPAKFNWAQFHSHRLPLLNNQKAIHSDYIFVAHLQWLSKLHVAIKQYYWKTMDYVNNKNFNVNIVGNSAYDASVNNFNWEYSSFPYELKIDPDIYNKVSIQESYKFKEIKRLTEKYQIPNLGDWGYDVLNIH